METYHNLTEFKRTVKNSENPYLTLSRKLTSDKRLNVIDKGILLDIFDNSDEYIFNANYMQKKSGIGKIQYQKSINKLIELGYIHKERIQCGVKWTFCEDSTNTIEKEKELVIEPVIESKTIQEGIIEPEIKHIQETITEPKKINKMEQQKETIEVKENKTIINEYKLGIILEENGIDKSIIKLIMLNNINARMLKEEKEYLTNNIDHYNSIVSQYTIIN